MDIMKKIYLRILIDWWMYITLHRLWGSGLKEEEKEELIGRLIL